jgi:chromosome segregation ATPase
VSQKCRDLSDDPTIGKSKPNGEWFTPNVWLNKEFKQKSEEYENQIKEFTEIRDHYKRQLEIRREAYQTLNQTIKSGSPDLGPVYHQLELKKNEFNELESELESLENQIKEKV